METDDLPVVLPSTTSSGLSLSLYVVLELISAQAIDSSLCRHPLPILNISEHLTRVKLQTNSNLPFGVYVVVINRDFLGLTRGLKCSVHC